MEQTPPRLEYQANAVILIENKMANPRIVAPVDMTAHRALEEGIT